MLFLNILLVLPAVTVLAIPGVIDTKFSEVIKRDDAIAGPPVPPIPSQTTTATGPFLSPSAIKTKTIAPLVPTTPSALIFPREDTPKPINHHTLYVPEPALPSFIDTASCICGLLASRSTLPNNGEISEMWRCVADGAHAVITAGNNGKWYNTSLPSEDLSGLGMPRNWGVNPPFLKPVFVLVFENGGAVYQVLQPQNAGALSEGDYNCTAVNDTEASGVFYASQED